MYGMDPGKWSGLTETTEEAAVAVWVRSYGSLGQRSGNGDGEKWVVSLTPSGPPPSPPLALVVSVTPFNT